MIVTSQSPAVITSGNTEVYQASIAMNEVTFDLMISGIYENKVLAPIREIICNARDSHVEAGKEATPISIHAPTPLEPYFSVTDYGLGMSKEIVTQLYMCLGSSSKRDNNKTVGAFGIGSKSPFALTDAFQVTSVYNGIKTAYHIYKNKGIPDIAVMFENKTIEGNGTEVKFSVNPNLIKNFNNNLKAFLKFFDFPCKMETLEDIKPNYPTVLFSYELEHDILGKVKAEVTENNCGILMGGVLYESNYLYDQNISMIVKLEIGSCRINPGREKTIEGEQDGGFKEALINVYQKSSKAYEDFLSGELDQFTTLRQVTDFVYKLSPHEKDILYTRILEKVKSFNIDHLGLARNSYRKGIKTFSGVSVRKFTEAYDVKGLIKNNISIFVTDAKHCKQRAEKIISDRRDILVIVSPEELLPFVDNPVFNDCIVYASDVKIDRDLETKQPKSSKTYTRYKGHKVFFISKEGELKYTYLTKDDIENIKDYIISEKNNTESVETELGCMYISVNKNYDYYLEALDVNEVYILTERQAKWCKGSQVKITKDKPYIRSLCNNYLYNNSYNDLIDEINLLYKLSGHKGRKVKVSYTETNVKMLGKKILTLLGLTKDLNLKIEGIRNEYNECLKKLKEDYPLLDFFMARSSLEKLIDNAKFMQYIADMNELKQHREGK